MAIFSGTRAPVAPSKTAKLIETVLRELGVEIEDAVVPARDGAMWGLMKGSAELYVKLIEEEDETYVQVMAPIMAVPAEDAEALFRRLLQLNAEELSGAAFGVRGDRVIVYADRPAGTMGRLELKDLIVRVGTYADHFDDALVAEFGGKKHSEV